MDVAGRQLAAIAGITEMLEHAGIEYWLFGGWAVDFYLGEATRSHGDVDFAVRSRDRAAIGELLNSDRWLHAPLADEDGGTGYERSGIRVELTSWTRARPARC